MQPLVQREQPPAAAWANALVVREGAPGVDFAVDWKPAWREFGSSVAAFFSGPRPEKNGREGTSGPLRVEWVRGRLPGRALAASTLWHVAAIWILILPIWGFLPEVKPTLAPVQIELTWYGETKDLPPISLPAADIPKARRAARRAPTPQPVEAPAADAFHPRQTILSLPVHITHPRQTLIQPSAPAAPPKIAPPLPNIVQWPTQEPAKPKLQYSTSASAPIEKRRAVTDVDAPEVANPEKNVGPINIATPTAPKLAPQMPINAMSARAAERRPTHSDAAAAPEVASPGEGDPNLARIIALSATPAPPAPNMSVPQGNLAARISVSPEGGKSSAEGGSAARSSNGAAGGAASANAAAGSAAGSSGSSLPATILISPGRAPLGGGGGGASTGNGPAGAESASRHAPGMVARPAPAEPAGGARVETARTRTIDPSMPPEKILSGKEVYTLHVNLPNLTSASGSWVLNFAQLDEGDDPLFHLRRDLSGLEVLATVDPKYPPGLIAEHVRGQVVLYAIIRKDGSVDSIQIVEGLDPQLDRNAMLALAQWKFSPAKRAGAPVDLEAVIYIPFNYQSPLQ